MPESDRAIGNKELKIKKALHTHRVYIRLYVEILCRSFRVVGCQCFVCT